MGKQGPLQSTGLLSKEAYTIIIQQNKPAQWENCTFLAAYELVALGPR